MRKKILAALSCAAFALLTAPARADVPPPWDHGCVGKNPTDACFFANWTEGRIEPGVCVATTCTTNLAWDGGTDCPVGATCGWHTPDSPYAYESEPCVVCQPVDAGAPADGGALSDAGDLADGASPADAAPEAEAVDLATQADAAAPPPQPAPPANAGVTPTPPATADSGCAVRNPAARLAGPWVLAGTLSLLVLLKRRRRAV